MIPRKKNRRLYLIPLFALSVFAFALTLRALYGREYAVYILDQIEDVA